MKKWWLVIPVLFALLFIYACGKVQPSSTPTVVANRVTFSGTVAASSSDLSQMGVGSLAIETMEQKSKRIQTLQAMGFDKNSINAMNLVPLAAGSDTVVCLNKVNADGSYTAVDTELLGSSSTYTLTDPAYSASNAYVITTIKTASATSKDLIIETIVDATPEAGSTTASLSGQNSTPQTSLLVKLIIDKIVKELGVNTLDAETIKLVKSLVVQKINTLVGEGLTLTTVKTTGQSENSALKDAAIQAFSDSVVLKAVQAIKFRAGLAKGATDLATAKKIIKEIFTYISGSPTGVPGEIVDSFATSYSNGITKTLNQIVPAANGALSPSGSVITEDNLALAIKTMIDATYQTAAATASDTGPQIKGQNPLVQAVLPASTFFGQSTGWIKAHNWTVPEMLVLMPALDSVITGYQMNYPKMMADLGLMTGITNEFRIMHSELRIESWEDWGNFTFDPANPSARPTVSSVLTSMLNVMNLVNPNATGNITAALTYTKSDGTSATANYVEQAFGAKSLKNRPITIKAGGSPPGAKMFMIAPWGDPSKATKITDFKRGTTATIKVFKDGSQITSKDVTIASADLSKATIVFKVPAPDKFNLSDSGITVLLATEKPVLSWTFSSSDGSTINFGGLTPAYAIEVRNMIGDNPDFSGQAVYSSWWRQDFPKGTQDETTSLVLPVISAGTYTIMGGVVGIDSGGWPIVSGPWRSSIFKVGNSASIEAKPDITITGVVTVPATVQGTVKVGIFKMDYNTNFMNSTVTPKFGPATLSGGNYSIVMAYSTLNSSGSGGYETIAWDDINADGKINGPTEVPSFPSKHMGFFAGTLDCKDQNFTYIGLVTTSENNSGYNIDMKKYNP